MTEENTAWLEQAEKEECPPGDRRLILSVVGKNLCYMPEAFQKRYEMLMAAQRRLQTERSVKPT